MQGRTSVSTPTTRTEGAAPARAAATPDTRPPPPTGTSTTSTSGTCSRISSATVPWPAMMAGSSKGWTKVRPSALLQAPRLGVGLVVVGALQDDAGAVPPGVGDLEERRRLRHHDGGRDAQPAGVVGHRLGVVAGARRHEAARPLLGREREQLVEGPALLVRARHLEVLELQVGVATGEPGEGLAAGARREVDVLADALARAPDLVEGDQHRPDASREPLARANAPAVAPRRPTAGSHTAMARCAMAVGRPLLRVTAARGGAPAPPGCARRACRRWS